MDTVPECPRRRGTPVVTRRPAAWPAGLAAPSGSPLICRFSRPKEQGSGGYRRSAPYLTPRWLSWPTGGPQSVADPFSPFRPRASAPCWQEPTDGRIPWAVVVHAGGARRDGVQGARRGWWDCAGLASLCLSRGSRGQGVGAETAMPSYQGCRATAGALSLGVLQECGLELHVDLFDPHRVRLAPEAAVFPWAWTDRGAAIGDRGGPPLWARRGRHATSVRCPVVTS